MIELIGPHSILPNWGSIEPKLQRALNEIDSGYGLDDILTALQLAQMQLWCINEWQAIVVTQIRILPLHKVLELNYLAGEGAFQWRDELEDAMNTYANAHNCKYVDLYGRDGWRKVLKGRSSLDKQFTVMRLRVNGR